MSALRDIAGTLVGGLWKVGAIAALAAGVLASAALGYQWHMAAHDRDVAKSDLVSERAKSAEYSGAIREQNRAVTVLADQKAAAEARGQAAQQLAAANGKRFDIVLAATRATHALNCADAMPVVDMVRDAVR